MTAQKLFSSNFHFNKFKDHRNTQHKNVPREISALGTKQNKSTIIVPKDMVTRGLRQSPDGVFTDEMRLTVSGRGRAGAFFHGLLQQSEGKIID